MVHGRGERSVQICWLACYGIYSSWLALIYNIPFRIQVSPKDFGDKIETIHPTRSGGVVMVGAVLGIDTIHSYSSLQSPIVS